MSFNALTPRHSKVIFVPRILTKNAAGQFEEGDSIELKFTEKKGYEIHFEDQTILKIEFDRNKYRQTETKIKR